MERLFEMNKVNEGLTKKQAKLVERTIVGFSILSLVFLFQPFYFCMCFVLWVGKSLLVTSIRLG